MTRITMTPEELASYERAEKVLPAELPTFVRIMLLVDLASEIRAAEVEAERRGYERAIADANREFAMRFQATWAMSGEQVVDLLTRLELAAAEPQECKA